MYPKPTTTYFKVCLGSNGLNVRVLSHQKFDEIRPWGIGLDPNLEQLSVLKFLDKPFLIPMNF
jgi:hypothetical protein